MTPSSPDEPTQPDDAIVSPLEELRERLRPRSLQGAGDTGVTAGERFALERVQALELQVATTHRRERELLELAVKDGNQISALQAELSALRDLAARAEAAEREVFEAETRAEGAVRRAELMDSELMSTRAEVDRLRTRIVELEASLRRALQEVGEATSGRGAAEALAEATGQQDTAEHSLELADRLRLKVVDLEASLRSVMSGVGETETSRMIAERGDEEQLAAEIQRATEIAGASANAAAQERLTDLEERLAALDSRIAGLSESMAPAEQEDLVVDIRDEEEPEIMEDLPPEPSEPIKPPASRWSDWRTT
jgi:hypothetical protein